MTTGKKPTPPLGRRVQTETQRIEDSKRAKTERDQRARDALGASDDFIEEGATDNYQGEELARRREKRPTPQRIALLEQKTDELRKEHAQKIDAIGKDVADTKNAVATLTGQTAGQDKVLANQNTVLADIRTTVKQIADREHNDLIAARDEKKARTLEKIHKGTSVRDWITKGIGVVGTIAAIVLAILQARKC